MRSGKTWESEPVWFSAESAEQVTWLVSEAGQRGEGDSYSRLLREIQNLLHELCNFPHNLLFQIIIASENEKKAFVEDGFLKVVA